ncbi:MAG TPA: pitrilysin family protein [Phycisphaerae bacterium]|nr:pitrilysin family protein [Phycisphaerae bacterium]
MKSFLRSFVVALVVAAYSTPAIFAANKPEKITTVEGITEYRLANGLKVLLFSDPSKPTVTVNITYFVGSRHEGYGETGMAHLLEHMVFKGTPNHPQVWKSLEDHGASFNGTTSFDRTNYFETMAATPENLEFGLKLEADRMVNSHIAKKDLESEFSVVRNEFEMGENNPLAVLEERIWSTAYLWHNYGKSTIGSREDIERVPIDRLQAFYKKFYQPDNAMLVVAGQFDEAKTLARINEIYGAIPKPTRVLDATYTVEPAQDGEREVTLQRVGDIQAIGAAYHICSGTHEDMPALDVLANIMDTTQTGRLYKALIETQMATQVRASAESLFDPGLISFSAQVEADKPLEPVRKTLLATIDKMTTEDVTREEVERAKNSYLKQFEMLMGDSGRVGVTISNWAAQGDWRLMFLYRDRMKKVTPEDVQRVAAHYLKPSNRTVGVFLPTKEPERTTVPPPPDVITMLKDYKGETAVAAGEAIEATPMAIEARTQRGQLANGIKTALLAKKSRGDRAFVELVLHYGSESTLKGRTDAAEFIAPMLERGTTKHTRREVADELDKLKANVRIGSGGGGGGRRGGRMFGAGGGALGTLSVSIEATRENLPKVIALVGEMLREPAFPQDEFDKLKKQRVSGIEQRRSEPTMQAMNALRRKTSPYSSDDIRYVPTIDEEIERTKAVKLEDVKKVYSDLVGASFGELAAVGAFEPGDLTGQFDKILAGWKSPKPFERVAMAYHEITPEDVILKTPDKAMALILLGTTLELRDDEPEYPAAQMGNMILGQGGDSRLLNRLRQKEGFSYSVSSALSVPSQDRAGSLMIFANCNPENAGPAMKAAQEELQKFLKDGITQKELDDAKKGYAQQVKVQLSQDGALAGMLARQTYIGRTMKFMQEQMDKIDALSVDDVNSAARKHINADKFINIQAGDLQEVTPPAAEPAPSGSAG